MVGQQPCSVVHAKDILLQMHHDRILRVVLKKPHHDIASTFPMILGSLVLAIANNTNEFCIAFGIIIAQLCVMLLGLTNVVGLNGVLTQNRHISCSITCRPTNARNSNAMRDHSSLYRPDATGGFSNGVVQSASGFPPVDNTDSDDIRFLALL